MGSLEITELIRRRLEHESLRRLCRFGISSVTSPFGGGGGGQAKGFWFNVNAELIIYGSTSPTRRSRSAATKSNASRRHVQLPFRVAGRKI